VLPAAALLAPHLPPFPQLAAIFSLSCQAALAGCRELGFTSKRMVSRAYHDALFMAHVSIDLCWPVLLRLLGLQATSVLLADSPMVCVFIMPLQGTGDCMFNRARRDVLLPFHCCCCLMHAMMLV